MDVTNAGGAVGFVAPVTATEVRPVAASTLAGVTDGPDRLLVGYQGDRLVAVLVIADNRFHLKAHWRVLKRVMVHPETQGRGHGAALMREAERIARALGLDALHVTVRDGLGLDRFYRHLGYREIGRLPAALRLSPADTRDEILMWLDLAAPREAGPTVDLGVVTPDKIH
nr:GNAT family N-acetyltransferase [Micromonospora sp. NBS 11-29]